MNSTLNRAGAGVSIGGARSTSGAGLGIKGKPSLDPDANMNDVAVGHCDEALEDVLPPISGGMPPYKPSLTLLSAKD